MFSSVIIVVSAQFFMQSHYPFFASSITLQPYDSTLLSTLPLLITFIRFSLAIIHILLLYIYRNALSPKFMPSKVTCAAL